MLLLPRAPKKRVQKDVASGAGSWIRNFSRRISGLEDPNCGHKKMDGIKKLVGGFSPFEKY